jgi:hypothetical protein
MTPYRVGVLAPLGSDTLECPLLAFLRNFSEYDDYQEGSEDRKQ